MRHDLEHFLKEAERCVPHLSAGARRAWAERCHVEHPGVTESHKTGAPAKAPPLAVNPPECQYRAPQSDSWRWPFRAIVLAALLFLCARAAHCQNPAGLDPVYRNLPLLWVSTAPNGSCTGVSVEYVPSTGVFYGCLSLSWTALNSPGGSSGTVTSVATNNGLTGGTITTTGTLGLASIATNHALCNNSGSSGAPTSANCTVTGTGNLVLSTSPSFTTSLIVNGLSTGTATIVPQSAASTPTLTLPNTTGTFAVGASSPLSLSATTGNLTCSTCLTTSSTVTLARGFGAVFDGGGSALTAGSTANVLTSVPYACTISGWTVMVDTGTASLDIWYNTGTTIPTSASSITDSNYPAIASGTSTGQNTTLTGWSTSIAAYGNIIVNLEAVSSATKVTLMVECDQTVTL